MRRKPEYFKTWVFAFHNNCKSSTVAYECIKQETSMRVIDNKLVSCGSGVNLV